MLSFDIPGWRYTYSACRGNPLKGRVDWKRHRFDAEETKSAYGWFFLGGGHAPSELPVQPPQPLSGSSPLPDVNRVTLSSTAANQSPPTSRGVIAPPPHRTMWTCWLQRFPCPFLQEMMDAPLVLLSPTQRDRRSEADGRRRGRRLTAPAITGRVTAYSLLLLLLLLLLLRTAASSIIRTVVWRLFSVLTADPCPMSDGWVHRGLGGGGASVDRRRPWMQRRNVERERQWNVCISYSWTSRTKRWSMSTILTR